MAFHFYHGSLATQFIAQTEICRFLGGLAFQLPTKKGIKFRGNLNLLTFVSMVTHMTTMFRIEFRIL